MHGEWDQWSISTRQIFCGSVWITALERMTPFYIGCGTPVGKCSSLCIYAHICLLCCRVTLVTNCARCYKISYPLRWSHNERDGVSNHQRHVYLLKRLFRRRSNKASKLRVTGLCAGNSPGIGEFPAQMASNAQSVSIWWRYYACATKYWFKMSSSHIWF